MLKLISCHSTLFLKLNLNLIELQKCSFFKKTSENFSFKVTKSKNTFLLSDKCLTTNRNLYKVFRHLLIFHTFNRSYYVIKKLKHDLACVIYNFEMSNPGVGKLRATGQMRPSKPKYAAREVLFSLKHTIFKAYKIFLL